MNQPPYGYPPGQYGPPPQPGYGPPGYGPTPMYGRPIIVANAKSPGLAAAFELLGGFFLQTFGIGHLYAGNVGIGLAFMFGYWVLTVVNIFLCFLLIGFITWPICWVAAMIIAPLTASSAATAANARLASGRLY